MKKDRQLGAGSVRWLPTFGKKQKTMILKSIRYWVGRMWLGGFFTILPLAIIVQTGGCLISISANSKITDYSVSVSDYYRLDGTHVSSHSRRPVGSVEIDRPHESFRTIGSIVSFAGFCWAAFTIFKVLFFKDKTLLGDRMPRRQYQTKPTLIASPDIYAKARKRWRCQRCKADIQPDRPYFYASEDRDRKFCEQCRMIVVNEAEAAKGLFADYITANKVDLCRYISEYSKTYRKYFGQDPENE